MKRFLERIADDPWLWGLRLALAVLGLSLFFVVYGALAEPLYEVQQDGVKITLTDEPCRLRDAVKNLDRRAVWEEKNLKSEGCFGQHPAGIVMFYFEDKTVFILPAGAFTRVFGA